jgi:hypothetical protein
MNNLAYTMQDPEKVAAKIEEIIKKDLGSDISIEYNVFGKGNDQTLLGSIAEDTLIHLFGKEEKVLFSVTFKIPAPREINIIVQVDRQGVGCHAGAIIFVARLKKPVSAMVTFEEPKTFGTPKFTGDTELAARLNSNKDLLKRIDKFSRVKSDIAGGLRLERIVQLKPGVGGTELVINTLARPTSMGFGATTDAKDFFEIVNLVEAAL